MKAMRIIQLSDIHLVSSREALIKGRNPMIHLKCALNESIKHNPDLILITGDICEDESRSGYKHLREELRSLSNSITIALLPGNHDNPIIMNEVLSPYATIAPAEILLKGIRLIILSSHIDGRIEGVIEQSQIKWLNERLKDETHKGSPLFIALHHPPLKIGDPFLDSVSLRNGDELLNIFKDIDELKAILFGHIHQYWISKLSNKNKSYLLGCPSTLCSHKSRYTSLKPVENENDIGGLLIEIDNKGIFTHKLIRWQVKV